MIEDKPEGHPEDKAFSINGSMGDRSEWRRKSSPLMNWWTWHSTIPPAGRRSYSPLPSGMLVAGYRMVNSMRARG